MAKRRLSRWLAPIALLGALFAILVVINNSDVGEKSDSSAKSPSVTGASETTKRPKRKVHSTYTVRTGDTLSSIAEKTGIPLEEIERLNPDLDEQTLHAGQKIKLTSS
jgi:LysM repeat protein